MQSKRWECSCTKACKDTLEKAERIAEEATKSIKGKLFHREDVGKRELIEKRIRHMKEVLVKQQPIQHKNQKIPPKPLNKR